MSSLPETLQVTPLHGSGLVRICDVSCRAHDRSRGAEECSATDDIVFPRVGFFVQHLGTRGIPADPNGVLLQRRGDVYRVSHPAACGDECTALTFAPTLLAEAFASGDPAAGQGLQRPFPTARVECPPDVVVSMHRLRRALHGPARSGPDIREMEVDALALELLDGVARAAAASARARRAPRGRDETQRTHHDLVERVRGRLSARLGERLSLALLARDVGSSPFHLARVFARHAGTPIHAYLVRLRLRAALERMAQGAVNLAELAAELGFSSHAHLTGAFRREFGTPPSALRRRLHVRAVSETRKDLEARPSSSS
jgi:AraC-like DNA-binding protein